MIRRWTMRVFTPLALGGAMALMSGCPLWNRFARDVGAPGLQVEYQPPIRQGAAQPQAADGETPSREQSIEPIEAALTDEEVAAVEPAENLGSRAATDGSMLPVLSVRELENGLIVEVLRLGDGLSCAGDSRVVIACRGEFPDGPVFDQALADQPYGPWRVDHLIVGMQQGIIGMRAGGMRRLTIPPALAYGSREVPGPAEGEVLIPTDSTLIYTVELLEIVADAEPPSESEPLPSESG
ncbi:MAG: FKBP-type peptidyl-prolyl cis-trans isomerase [Phycisphaerales bacterium JB038]